MSTDAAPPVDRKQEILSELRRRAGTNTRALEIVGEMERRAGSVPGAEPPPATPLPDVSHLDDDLNYRLLVEDTKKANRAERIKQREAQRAADPFARTPLPLSREEVAALPPIKDIRTTAERQAAIDAENERRFGEQAPDQAAWELPARVVRAGGRAVTGAIGEGLHRLGTGETMLDRAAGAAQAGFGVLPIVAGLNAAQGALGQAQKEDIATGGTGESKIAEYGAMGVTKPMEWGGQAGAFVGRNAALDQSTEGRAAGAEAGREIGQYVGPMIGAKAAGAAWRNSPQGKAFAEGRYRASEPVKGVDADLARTTLGPESATLFERGVQELTPRRALPDPMLVDPQGGGTTIRGKPARAVTGGKKTAAESPLLPATGAPDPFAGQLPGATPSAGGMRTGRVLSGEGGRGVMAEPAPAPVDPFAGQLPGTVPSKGGARGSGDVKGTGGAGVIPESAPVDPFGGQLPGTSSRMRGRRGQRGSLGDVGRGEGAVEGVNRVVGDVREFVQRHGRDAEAKLRETLSSLSDAELAKLWADDQAAKSPWAYYGDGRKRPWKEFHDNAIYQLFDVDPKTGQRRPADIEYDVTEARSGKHGGRIGIVNDIAESVARSVRSDIARAEGEIASREARLRAAKRNPNWGSQDSFTGRRGGSQSGDVEYLGSGGGNLDFGRLGELYGKATRSLKGDGSLILPTGGTVSDAKGGRFNRNIESFRTQFKGEGGQRMSDALGNIEFEARRQIGDLRVPIERALPANPKKHLEVTQNLDLWISGEKPTPKWAQPVVDQVRAAMKRQPEKYENPAGVRITEERTTDQLPKVIPKDWEVSQIGKRDSGRWRIVRPVPSDNPKYVPGGGTADAIKAIIAENDAHAAEIAAGNYKNAPLTAAWMKKNTENPWTAEARLAAEKEAASRTGPQQRRTSFIESYFPGAEKAHKFNWPREMQNPDKLELYFNRIQKGAYNSAEHKEFGYRYTTKDGNTLKEPGRFEEILQQISADGGKRDIAEDRALRLLHRDPHGQMSGIARKAQTAEGIYTTGSKLSGSLIQIPQQLGQFANQYIEGGVGPVARGTSKVAPRPVESVKGARQRGDIQPDAYLQSMDLFQEGAGGVPTRVAKGAIKATQIPQTTIDALARATASEGASKHLENISAAFGRKGLGNRVVGRDASWADRALLRLDLPKADRQAIRDGKITPDIEAKFRQAYTRYTNNESGVPEFPRVIGELGSDPRLGWARRFTSWSASQARFFKESVVDEGLHGNLAPAARFTIATLLVGEGVHKARDAQGAITGNPQDRDDIRDIIANRDWEALRARLWQDLTAAGTAGMWSSASKNAAEGRPGWAPAVMTVYGGTKALWDTIASDKEASDIWWGYLEKEFPQAKRWAGK